VVNNKISVTKVELHNKNKLIEAMIQVWHRDCKPRVLSKTVRIYAKASN